jgi:hypothetical protein
MFDETDPEPQRCRCRCSVHQYIPCAISPCVAHDTHECVLCRPKRFTNPRYQNGDRVKKRGEVLVVCGVFRMSLGWVYSCHREDDPQRQQAPYTEQGLDSA